MCRNNKGIKEIKEITTNATSFFLTGSAFSLSYSEFSNPLLISEEISFFR